MLEILGYTEIRSEVIMLTGHVSQESKCCLTDIRLGLFVFLIQSTGRFREPELRCLQVNGDSFLQLVRVVS